MSEKVYGLHAVRALLTRHAERVTQVTIAEGRADPRMTEIQTLAQKSGKNIKRAAPAVFKQLFGEAVHQGVFVDVLPLAMWHEEELVGAISIGLAQDQSLFIALATDTYTHTGDPYADRDYHDLSVLKLTTHGERDPGFSQQFLSRYGTFNPKVQVAALPDGSAVVNNEGTLQRVKSDGTIDDRFGYAGDEFIAFAGDDFRCRT